jgi:nitrate/nitrite transporter NarK
VVAVSRWFVTNRGLALGIILAGTSIGNGFMPKIFTDFIADDGVRAASHYAAWLLLAMPVLMLVLLREWPASVGLKPYGADGAPAAANKFIGEELSYADILRRKDFWLMGVAAFATFYSILGVNNNMILHMQNLQVPPSVGSLIAIPLFLAGVVGKLGAGWLTDRLGRKQVWLWCLGLMLLGALLLSLMQTALVPFAAVIMGLGWGANYTLLQAVAGDLFGTRSLGKVMGAVTVLDAGGGAIGPWLTARFADQTGNYQLGFLVISGLILAALIAAWRLKVETPDLVLRQPSVS